jgi:hypothetical protein
MAESRQGPKGKLPVNWVEYTTIDGYVDKQTDRQTEEITQNDTIPQRAALPISLSGQVEKGISRRLVH